MARTKALTEEQLKAVSLLADGMTQSEAAKVIGRNRITINRWAGNENFSAELAKEIERRQERIKTRLQEVADVHIDHSVATIKEELAAYHAELIAVQKQRLQHGRDLIEKAMDRLKDLSGEAFSPSDAIRLLDAGDKLYDKGMTDWGDAIAVGEVVQRLSASGD